jgi:hypothetical protein
METALWRYFLVLLLSSVAQAQAPEHANMYWADRFPGKDLGEKINSAVAAASGGVIKIPAGQFAYSTPIKINKNIRLEGSGKTTLVSASATSDQIDVLPGANYATIADLGLYTEGRIKPTSGAGIRVNASFVRISDVTVWNQYDGIVSQGPQNLQIEDCDIRAVHDEISVSGTLNVTITQSKLYSGGASSTGLRLTRAGGVWLTDVDIFNGLHGVVFDPPAGAVVGQVLAKGVVVDSTSGHGIVVGGSGTVFHVDFSGSWTAGSAQGNGISFENANTNGFSWRGGFIRGNHLNGAYIHSGTNIQVIGTQVSANGQRNATHDNTYGIRIGPGAKNVRISECFLGPTGNDNATQTYGVFVDSGATDFLQIIGNIDTGDTKGLVADYSKGKHKVISGNLPE